MDRNSGYHIGSSSLYQPQSVSPTDYLTRKVQGSAYPQQSSNFRHSEISQLTSSIAEKALSFRTESIRLRAILTDQRNALRDSEAFIESVFIDGKWEKRLICSALGRIIGGIRDGSLDRMTMVRQIALLVNLVHNSIDNPVLYVLSEADEKDFINTRPVETINSMLQGKFDTIELKEGYSRLLNQYQRLKQQFHQQVNGASNRLGSDAKNTPSPKSLTVMDRSPDSLNDSSLEQLLLALDEEIMKISKASSSHVGDAKTSQDSLNLRAQNKSLNDEISQLKSEKNDAIKDIAALRDYASELQSHLEMTKKSHSDAVYDLRLSNELLRLRELEANNRVTEIQSSIQTKDDTIRQLEANLFDVSQKYQALEGSEASRFADTKRTIEAKDRELSSLLDSLAQVTSHLNDTKKEFSIYKSNSETNLFEQKNRIDSLIVQNNELSLEVALANQKLSMARNRFTDDSMKGPQAELSSQIKKLLAALSESDDKKHFIENENKALRELVNELEERIQLLRGEAETMDLFHRMTLSSTQTSLLDAQQQTNHFKELHAMASEDAESERVSRQELVDRVIAWSQEMQRQNMFIRSPVESPLFMSNKTHSFIGTSVPNEAEAMDVDDSDEMVHQSGSIHSEEESGKADIMRQLQQLLATAMNKNRDQEAALCSSHQEIWQLKNEIKRKEDMVKQLHFERQSQSNYRRQEQDSLRQVNEGRIMLETLLTKQRDVCRDLRQRLAIAVNENRKNEATVMTTKQELWQLKNEVTRQSLEVGHLRQENHAARMRLESLGEPSIDDENMIDRERCDNLRKESASLRQKYVKLESTFCELKQELWERNNECRTKSQLIDHLVATTKRFETWHANLATESNMKAIDSTSPDLSTMKQMAQLIQTNRLNESIAYTLKQQLWQVENECRRKTACIDHLMSKLQARKGQNDGQSPRSPVSVNEEMISTAIDSTASDETISSIKSYLMQVKVSADSTAELLAISNQDVDTANLKLSQLTSRLSSIQVKALERRPADPSPEAE